VVDVGYAVLAGSDQLDWSQVKIAVGFGNDALTVYLIGLMTCWIGLVGCSDQLDARLWLETVVDVGNDVLAGSDW